MKEFGIAILILLVIFVVIPFFVYVITKAATMGRLEGLTQFFKEKQHEFLTKKQEEKEHEQKRT